MYKEYLFLYCYNILFLGGSPPPMIEWMKNGEPAINDDINYTTALDRDTPALSTITVIPEKVRKIERRIDG